MSSTIDLFGWDTTFGISYAQANAAIVAEKTTPPTFEYTDTGAGVSISGNWGDWQITTGGDGQNLHMHCPVASGTGSGVLGTIDLAGGYVVIEVKLEKLPDPSIEVKDPTGKGGISNKLIVKTLGTEEEPAVSIVSWKFDNAKGMWALVISGLFEAWFLAHLDEFNHVFSVVALNVKADVDDYAWLKPTELSYACADAIQDPMNKSVFAVLCKTENDPIGSLAHQVDARILDGLPADANSSFALGPEKVLKHIFLPGAVAVIQGSTIKDFNITDDQLWLVNNKDLTWGNFELDDGKKVSPVINQGDFLMGIEGSFVKIEITNAHFKWPSWHGPGDINVSMNLTQHFEFELKQVTKGWVFIPKEGVGTKHMTANVTTTKGVDIFELCMGIAASIIGAILGSALAGCIEAGSCVAVEAVDQGVIEIEESAIEEAAAEAGEEAVAEAEQAAATAAVDAVENAGNPGYWARFTSAMCANKWKLLGGAIGTIIGAQAGLISQYIKLAAEGDLEKLPTFDKFALNCISTTTFPNTNTWTLKAAELRGPLVIYGKLE
jgi:hypothetical protein